MRTHLKSHSSNFNYFTNFGCESFRFYFEVAMKILYRLQAEISLITEQFLNFWSLWQLKSFLHDVLRIRKCNSRSTDIKRHLLLVFITVSEQNASLNVMYAFYQIILSFQKVHIVNFRKWWKYIPIAGQHNFPSSASKKIEWRRNSSFDSWERQDHCISKYPTGFSLFSNRNRRKISFLEFYRTVPFDAVMLPLQETKYAEWKTAGPKRHQFWGYFTGRSWDKNEFYFYHRRTAFVLGGGSLPQPNSESLKPPAERKKLF